MVFAFETTRQPLGLLPLRAGGTAAFLISCLLMKNSIMTEKIARRGVHVLAEYEADHLDRVRLTAYIGPPLVTLRAHDELTAVRTGLTREGTHNGFPVLDDEGVLVGVVSRRELMAGAAQPRVAELVKRAPVVVHEQQSLRDAADAMARAGVGRLPIVERARPHHVLGMVTRSDLVSAHVPRLAQQTRC